MINFVAIDCVYTQHIHRRGRFFIFINENNFDMMIAISLFMRFYHIGIKGIAIILCKYWRDRKYESIYKKQDKTC